VSWMPVHSYNSKISPHLGPQKHAIFWRGQSQLANSTGHSGSLTPKLACQHFRGKGQHTSPSPNPSLLTTGQPTRAPPRSFQHPPALHYKMIFSALLNFSSLPQLNHSSINPRDTQGEFACRQPKHNVRVLGIAIVLVKPRPKNNAALPRPPRRNS
jgi:hypothetical protein